MKNYWDRNFKNLYKRIKILKWKIDNNKNFETFTVYTLKWTEAFSWNISYSFLFSLLWLVCGWKIVWMKNCLILWSRVYRENLYRKLTIRILSTLPQSSGQTFCTLKIHLTSKVWLTIFSQICNITKLISVICRKTLKSITVILSTIFQNKSKITLMNEFYSK